MTVFGSTAEAVAKHLDKGRKVLVEGRLRYPQRGRPKPVSERAKLDVIAERVNFLPRASKNGNGSENGANEFDGTIPDDLGRYPVLTPWRLEGLLRLALEIPRKALTLYRCRGFFCFHPGRILKGHTDGNDLN